MKILIYGSTPISALVEAELMKNHEVQHIPSVSPVFIGEMKSPKGYFDYDIAISVQYDRKIEKLENTFNLHTGLLPSYGGCDILYHTIKERPNFQGLTFHKITENFDEGDIVALSLYPVFETDKAVDLYKRICSIAPHFVSSCVKLPLKGIPSGKPRLFKRGEVDDKELYKQDYEDICEYLKSL